MKRSGSQPTSISQVMERVFQRVDPENRREVYRVWSFWEDEVGEAIARRAEPAGVHAGVLSVRVNSHAWMQELQFAKETIRERLNARLGQDLIHDIHFISGVTTACETTSVGAGKTEDDPPTSEEPPLALPVIRDPALAKVFDRIAHAHVRQRSTAPTQKNTKTESRKPGRS